MNDIVMIPVERIKPHPHNPRQELGDLTELAESIKSRGIMQNLTVVFDGDGGYTAVIGHRRLAAAKLAGLDKVPCVIAEMDEGEQLATMLLENMQRSDLTVYEQAEGVQLLLDMDFSVADIAQKTGFSESTVRRRAKLTTLDKKKFKASQARQVSLSDYEKLFEIEDEETRNKLLDKIGTAEFNNSFESTVKLCKAKKNMESIKAKLAGKGVKLFKNTENPYSFGYTYFDYFTVADVMPRTPTLTEGEFAMKISSFGTSYGVTIYRKDDFNNKKDDETQRKKDIKMEKDRRFSAEAREINERMEKLRNDFVVNYSLVGRKANRPSREDLIIKAFVEMICTDDYNPDILKYDTLDNPTNFDEVYDRDGGLAIMLCVLAHAWSDGGYIDAWDRNKPIKDKDEKANLNRLYYLLTRLGYEMCDEEKQLRDGTHEIYTKYKDKD